MKKTILIFLAGLLAIGGGLVFYLSKNKNQSVSLNSNPEKVDEIENTVDSLDESSLDGNEINNLENLIASGKSIKCNFQDGTLEGVYYIDGKNDRVRMDSEMIEDGQTIKNNLLVLGKETYSWSDDGVNKVGYKFIDDGNEEIDNDFEELENNLDRVEEEMREEGINPEDEDLIDYEAEIKGECQVWKLDESVFAIPSDVEFNDMNALTDQFEKMIGDQESLTEENLDEYMKQLEGMGVDLGEGDLEEIGDLDE